MEMKDKIVDKLKRGALSCGSFTTAYAVATMLFIVPYVYSYGGALVAAFLPIAFILPFVVMPVIYSVMHRFDPLLFGRYHLFMPVSAAVASLFFVIALSSAEKSAAGAAFIFFGMTVFVSMLLIYRYCTFSVAARLANDNIGKKHISHGITALIGAVCAVCTMYGFYRYDPATMYVNCAFVLAAACLIVSFVGYMATFNDVPVLHGKHVQSVAEVFKAFYGGINKRTYFSSLTLLSAFMIISALAFSLALSVSDAGIAFVSAFVSVAVFAAAYAVASKTVDRRRASVVAVIGVCLVASAALFCASSFVKHVALIIAPAVLAPIGGAFALRHMCLRFLAIKPRVTSGVVYNLMSITVCAAFAVALAVAAVVINVPHGFAYGFGAGGAFAVAGLVLSGQKRRSAATPHAARPLDADGETSDQTIIENPPEKENV